jgi:hypothetical protein
MLPLIHHFINIMNILQGRSQVDIINILQGGARWRPTWAPPSAPWLAQKHEELGWYGMFTRKWGVNQSWKSSYMFSPAPSWASTWLRQCNLILSLWTLLFFVSCAETIENFMYTFLSTISLNSLKILPYILSWKTHRITRGYKLVKQERSELASASTVCKPILRTVPPACQIYGPI